MNNAVMPAVRQRVQLRRRRRDWILLAFFALNLFFITYFVDIEQLTIANPFHFSYPLCPPTPFRDHAPSYVPQPAPPGWRWQQRRTGGNGALEALTRPGDEQGPASQARGTLVLVGQGALVTEPG